MKMIVITRKHLMAASCVMLSLVLIAIGSVVTFAKGERKLPIYCVETDEKKIAISFDAAWGNSKKVQNTN